MSSSSTENRLKNLTRSLGRMPGIGQKTAQRLVMHLLHNDREGAHEIAQTLLMALEGIHHCERCHTLTEHTVCALCQDTTRDACQICIVETPADQAAVERTGSYRGFYFILMGRINPLAGSGVHDIGLEELLERVKDGQVLEAIIATNFTTEGEATAHIVSELLKSRDIRCTRLARGVPIGSELEYVDLGTISFALSDRR